MEGQPRANEKDIYMGPKVVAFSPIVPGLLAEMALKSLKVADGRWGLFVYERQRICTVLHELLKEIRK